MPDADPPHELGDRLDRVPPGWTSVHYRGKRYGMTRQDAVDHRSISIYAEELGGSDVISTNVYRTGDGDLLRPCEMPAEKVLAFLDGWTEAEERSTAGPAGSAPAGHEGRT